MSTVSHLRRSTGEEPRLLIFGREGVTLEVVTFLLARAGWDELEPPEPTGAAAPKAPAVVVVVEPDRNDWVQALALDSPIILVVDMADLPSALDRAVLCADAIVTTEVDPARLIEVVKVVGAGGSVMPPKLTRELLARRDLRSACDDLLCARADILLRHIALRDAGAPWMRRELQERRAQLESALSSSLTGDSLALAATVRRTASWLIFSSPSS